MSLTDWNYIDSLARKSLLGDKKAYKEFLISISSYINLKVKKTLPQGLREDASQEILMAIHKSMKTLDNAKSCKAWVNAIAHYKVCDVLRRIYKEKDHIEFVDHQDREIDNVLIKQYIEKIKNSLKENESTILFKLKYEGHSISEVASEMGMSENNVKVISFRAIRKARELIIKEEFYE